MNARNLTVEQALSATESHVTAADLSAMTGITVDAVNEELKRLADAGDLSHIPAGRGKAARYALLANPPGSDSEGGEPDIVAAELANARALVAKLERLLESKTHECEALREAALHGPQTEVAGYLLRVKRRKSRLFLNRTKARAAALSAAKTAGRADVFSLVPDGKAVRGAEWVSL